MLSSLRTCPTIPDGFGDKASALKIYIVVGWLELDQVVGFDKSEPSPRPIAGLRGRTAIAGIIRARLPEGCCSEESWTTFESTIQLYCYE